MDRLEGTKRRPRIFFAIVTVLFAGCSLVMSHSAVRSQAVYATETEPGDTISPSNSTHHAATTANEEFPVQGEQTLPEWGSPVALELRTDNGCDFDESWPFHFIGPPDVVGNLSLPKELLGQRPLSSLPSHPPEPASDPPESQPSSRGASGRPQRHATPPAVAPLVARRANDRVEYGFDLARRGAFYSARAEFLGALQMITQSLDQTTGTAENSHALTAGFRALQEARDFVARDTTMPASMDLATIVSSHQTPVLARAEMADVTTAVAMQRYFEYAKEHLAKAGGSEPVASMAIYGLARIETELAQQQLDIGAGAGYEPIALHQAAVMVDPKNYRAANDLGVLLARFGQLGEARTALSHSLEVRAHPSTWKSLSVVHHRLGEVELAPRRPGIPIDDPAAASTGSRDIFQRSG